MIYLISTLIFCNFFLFIFHKKISKEINVYDSPNRSRKIHKTPVPLVGGIFLIINFIIIFGLSNILNIQLFNIFSFREIVLLFIFSICFFLLGFYDDYYEIGPNIKLFLIFFLILFFLTLNPSLIIHELKFSFSNYSLKLKYFSIFFTILSIMLFINAINMFDGINCQVLIYFFVTIIFFVIVNKNFNFLIFFIPVMLILVFLNYKNYLFIGNGGSNFLSFFFSIIFIKSYLTKVIIADQIFLIMMIPGIDMLRLFIYRILKNKNPFLADNNHFHHILLKKWHYKITIFCSFIIILLSFILVFYKIDFFISIIVLSALYFLLILKK